MPPRCHPRAPVGARTNLAALEGSRPPPPGLGGVRRGGAYTEKAIWTRRFSTRSREAVGSAPGAGRRRRADDGAGSGPDRRRVQHNRWFAAEGAAVPLAASFKERPGRDCSPAVRDRMAPGLHREALYEDLQGQRLAEPGHARRFLDAVFFGALSSLPRSDVLVPQPTIPENRRRALAGTQGRAFGGRESPAFCGGYRGSRGPFKRARRPRALVPCGANADGRQLRDCSSWGGPFRRRRCAVGDAYEAREPLGHRPRAGPARLEGREALDVRGVNLG